MGIKNFGKTFFEKYNLKDIPKLRKIYVDSSYYFIVFQRNINFYVNKYKFEELNSKNRKNLITEYFIKWLLNRIIHCSEEIIFVLDSPFARKLSKWPSCLKRNYDNLINVNIDNFQQILNFYSNVKLVVSEYDADMLIFSLVKNEEKNKNTYLINNEEISDIAILSGDSDYLAMFPLKQDCIIMDLIEAQENNPEKNNFSILNFRHLLFSSNSKAITTYYDKLFLCTDASFFIVNTSTWLLGATLPNDYISANFWYFEKFRRTLLLFKKYFKKTNNYNYKSLIEKSSILPFLYFENYLNDNTEKIKKELFSNSFRFLSFSNSDTYYLYDLVTSRPITNLMDNFETLELLFKNIVEFNPIIVGEKEKSFKKNDIHKKVVYLKEFFNFFIYRNIRENEFKEKCKKFYFISSCCIFMMFFSLSIIFFNIENIGNRNIQFYFANIVWRLLFISRFNYCQEYTYLYFNFINKYLSVNGCTSKIEQYKFFKIHNKIFSYKRDQRRLFLFNK